MKSGQLVHKHNQMYSISLNVITALVNANSFVHHVQCAHITLLAPAWTQHFTQLYVNIFIT